MKRLASIIILFIFLFLLAGQTVVYVACIYENREMIRESIQNGQYSVPELVFSITKSQAHVIIERNEITWQGHRYDIVKIERRDSATIVHAINDAAEERLVASMNENYPGANQTFPISHRPSHLLNDFSKEYLSIYNPKIVSCYKNLSSFIHSQCTFAADGFVGNNVPPPKNFIG